MRKTVFAILVSLVFQANSLAIGEPLQEPLSVDDAFAMSVSRGQGGSLAVEWIIADGYYLYRDRLTARSESGAELPVTTPPGIKKDDPNFGRSEIYYDRADATIAHTGPSPIEITYQGCQEDGICYAPERRIVDPLTLAVSGSSTPGSAAGQWSTESPSRQSAAASLQNPTQQLDAAEDEGLVQSLKGQGGALLVLAMFPLLGVLLAFTPCVLPMYPILAGALARESERLTPRRGFALSTSYVVGLATAFAILGAIAGWSGQNLQMVLQSSWTTGVIAVVFVILALPMFGLFELQLPTAWTSAVVRQTGRLGGTMGAAALLGFSSALIVGPCVTPPLAGALLYIAQTGDVSLGASALFALAIGKGLPLIALGTLGGGTLPRAGVWMKSVRSLFGFLLLASAIWVATPLLPPGIDLALWAVLLVGLASFTLTPTPSRGPALAAGRAVGAVALIYGAILMVGVAAGARDPLRPLAIFAGRGAAGQTQGELDFAQANSLPQLQKTIAAADGRPSLIYFTAEWCTTCRTIERAVLPDRGVRETLSEFQLVKADLTDFDEESALLTKQLGVVGPPTMLFFRGTREVPGTRLVGDISIESLTSSAHRSESR
ncbi:protein-disulfide reductase DsbD [Chelativorans sp. J32]|uniref:protein-disulfide reductase DsbD n=1 Tax=Chelativorans sp. J32 TaxID=935840 RepID=UPI0004856EA1|nr:protein-disulfide reductase DsbD [Chelativorans sp. J32]